MRWTKVVGLVCIMIVSAMMPTASATHTDPDLVHETVAELDLEPQNDPDSDTSGNRFNDCYKFVNAGDPFLRQNNTEFDHAGDISVAIAFTVDNTGNNHNLFFHSEPTAFNLTYGIGLDTAQDLDYRHHDSAGTLEEITATDAITTTGFHTVWFTRDVSENRVVINADGTEVANNTYTNDPTTGGPNKDLFMGAFRENSAEMVGDICEVRYWEKVVPQSTLNKVLDESDSTFNRTLVGDETAAWFIEDDPVEQSAPRLQADLSFQMNCDAATGVRTNWSTNSNDRYRVVGACADGGVSPTEGRIHVLNDKFAEQDDFRSCKGENQEPNALISESIAVTYDDWIVQGCFKEASIASYEFDGQVGSLSINTCGDGDPTNLKARTLNDVLYSDNDEFCYYESDLTDETTLRRPNNAQSADISLNHVQNETRRSWVAISEWATNAEWMVLDGIGGSTVVGPISESLGAIEIHNDTVWTNTITQASGGNQTLNRWDMWQNSTGDWQIGSSPNKSISQDPTALGGLHVSKDGAFLISVYDSVMSIRNSTTLEKVVDLDTGSNANGPGADMGPCNNFVFTVNGTSANIQRFDVAANISGPVGDGDPNPCPDANQTQAQFSSVGTPDETDFRDVDEGVTGEPGSRDAGMLGQNVIESVSEGLGVNVTGAKIFMAGLLITGMAMGSVAMASKEQLGLSNGGVAIAGGTGGAIISLGLGLLPVWFFALIGLVAIAAIIWRR